MQINIGEVTFNTEFAPKSFVSSTFFAISGANCWERKKEKLFLNPWNYFSRCFLLTERIQILNNVDMENNKSDIFVKTS